MASIKQSNPKAFKELDVKLKELEGSEGRVGWFDDARSTYEDGTPVAYVAAIQELGYGPIPPRPFMRPAAEKHADNEWTDVAGDAAKDVLDGKKTGAQAMGVLAARAEGDVLRAIVDVNSPALSPITLWAREYRRRGVKVTGKTIGEIAGKIASGELSAGGPAGISTKPLNDTGHMIATLSHQVVSAS